MAKLPAMSELSDMSAMSELSDMSAMSEMSEMSDMAVVISAMDKSRLGRARGFPFAAPLVGGLNADQNLRANLEVTRPATLPPHLVERRTRQTVARAKTLTVRAQVDGPCGPCAALGCVFSRFELPVLV
jgi:hypothetical protein